MKRKAIKIRSDVTVTFMDLILTPFDLISTIMGIEPGISMMAKSTMNAARISLKLKCIVLICCKYKTIPLFPPTGGERAWL
jgi:hypothetical protein